MCAAHPTPPLNPLQIVGVVTKEHHFPLFHSIAQQRCEATLGRECYLTPVTNTASLRLLLKEDVGRWPMDDLRFVVRCRIRVSSTPPRVLRFSLAKFAIHKLFEHILRPS